MIVEKKKVTITTIELIAGTRIAFGLGLGLLLAGRFSSQQRQIIGWTLLAAGALTTIPLAAAVYGDGKTRSQPDLRVQRNPIAPYVTTS